MTTITLSYRAIQNKIASVNFLKINWKIVCLLGILFSLLMLFFYIFLVNGLTKGTYLIKNYNKEINVLSEENRQLGDSFAQASFLGGLQVRVKELSFEKTTQVKYLEILESSLAKAK